MRLNLSRLRYLGLHKVAAMTTTGHTKVRTRTFDAGFRTATPDGGFRNEVKDLPELATNPTFLRERAMTLVKKLSSDADVILPGSNVQVDQWHQIAGHARYLQTFHDDFRDQPDAAPRVAAWLMEIPDPGAATVTWVVLHGTADGNMFTSFDESLPATRAGSGTEALFEFLYARANDDRLREGTHAHRFRPEMLAWAVSEMFNDYSSHRDEDVEALFRVADVLTIPALDLPDELPLVSILGLSERSQHPRESKVSRVIIGSPLAVQAPKRSRSPHLLRRLRTALSGAVPRFDALERDNTPPHDRIDRRK